MAVTPFAIVEYLLLGLAVGFAGGLFGIGGGIIAIPALGLLGLTEQLSQGTSLIGQLPSALFGFIQYRKRSTLDLAPALMLGASAIPFAYLGGFIANHVSSPSLRRAFASFVVVIATFLVWRALRRVVAPGAARPFTWPFAVVIGALSGLFSGLFGIGGAVFSVPILTLLFGMTQVQAQGLGLAVVLPSVMISIVAYVHAGSILWPIGIPLAVGSFSTVSLGVSVAHRLPERVLRLAFCGVLYAAAIALWNRV